MRENEVKIRGIYNKIIKVEKITPESGMVKFEFMDENGNKYFHYQNTPDNVDSHCKSKARDYLAKFVKHLNKQKGKSYIWKEILPDCLSLRNEEEVVSDLGIPGTDIIEKIRHFDFTVSEIAIDAKDVIVPVHVVEREMDNGKIYKDADQIYWTKDFDEDIIWFKKRWRETERERNERILNALENERKRKLKEEARIKRENEKDLKRREKYKREEQNREWKRTGKFTLNYKR